MIPKAQRGVAQFGMVKGVVTKMPMCKMGTCMMCKNAWYEYSCMVFIQEDSILHSF